MIQHAAPQDTRKPNERSAMVSCNFSIGGFSGLDFLLVYV